MPRPNLPPTPAASTDITGEDKPRRVSLETSFELPPPAVHSLDRASPLTTVSSTSSNSTSSYNPATPTSPTYKALNTSPRLKRTSSGANKKPKEDFILPPPPARPRKIIHMKPKSTSDQANTPITNSPAQKTMLTTSPTSSSAKRKQPSSTSVAGRKIARKTAHSLIERRRRSKMNEEFATLKDMIPACEGQEMHKLAILQASIDYVRYLEDCVKDLKDANQNTEYPPEERRSSKKAPQRPAFSIPLESQQSEADRPPRRLQASPIIREHSPQDRHYSFASSTTSTGTPMPSPAFGPAVSQLDLQSPLMRDKSHSTQITPYMAAAGMSSTHSVPSALPSPNILPQAALDGNSMDIDRDHEATAALLMLTNDRRGIGGSTEDLSGGSGPRKRATAMSVKELLST